MKILLTAGIALLALLALLWTGFIGISAALADWVLSQGGQLQGGLHSIAQWPLPAWVTLWFDPAAAEMVHAATVWLLESLTRLMPWILPILGWVAPLLWVVWALGMAALVIAAAIGWWLIARVRQQPSIA
jgi:hypothetical protein